jgi:ribosomal protein L24
MKFKYGDIVYIRNGFYKGYEGVVTNSKETIHNNIYLSKIEYFIEFPTEEDRIERQWIDVQYLDGIKKMEERHFKLKEIFKNANNS